MEGMEADVFGAEWEALGDIAGGGVEDRGIWGIEEEDVQVGLDGEVVGRRKVEKGRVVKKVPEEGEGGLKEKRLREARMFPRAVLGNLAGTTSAEVRKMNATERELVLYKRKLRNRESARRSRQKRQATLAELQEEMDDLMSVTGRIVEVGMELRLENSALREKLDAAHAEIKALRDKVPEAPDASLKMKLGG